MFARLVFLAGLLTSIAMPQIALPQIVIPQESQHAKSEQEQILGPATPRDHANWLADIRQWRDETATLIGYATSFRRK